MKHKTNLIISLSIIFILFAQLFATPTTVKAHWLYGDIENGILVKQKDGVSPKTKVIYYPEDAAKDPWKGGYADFVWEDTVSPTLTALGGSDALQAAKNGLNFAARINLPDSITAKDVVESLDYDESYLYVGSAEPYKLDTGFFSYDHPDDHYLYFTMRKGASFNKLVQWLLDIIKSIITNFSGSLDVKLVAKINVSKLTKNGYPNIDKSPNQQLTKGMAPPSPDKHLKFGVNFYGHNQISWEGIEPTPTNGNENANPSWDNFPTWNTYLSPWDNKGTFNTGINNTPENWEQVIKDGTLQSSFLPGPFTNRKVSFKSWEYPNLTNVGNRFNRLVNIFTKEDVTTGGKITHNNDELITVKETKVTFDGTDAQGTLLSPREMTFVRDDDSLSASLNSSAVKIYHLSDSLIAPIDFTQLDIRSKKLSVTMTDSNSSTTSNTSVAVKNAGSLEKTNITLPDDYLTIGKHHTILSIKDEFNRIVEVPYAYIVLDLPKFTGTKTLANDSTNSTETLTINPGQNVSIISNFVTDESLKMEQAIIKSILPESTSLISGSTKIEIGSKTISIPDSAWTNDNLNYQLSSIPAGQDIKLSYQVTTSKNDKGKTLPVKMDTIEANSTIDGESYPLGQTNSANIFINNGELKFGTVTNNASFGTHDIPDQITKYQRQSPDNFSINVFDSHADSNFNWTLSGKMIDNLADENGNYLAANLLLIQDKNLQNKYPGLFDNQLSFAPNDAQIIYTNTLSNSGMLDFNWPMNTGLALEVSNNQKISDTTDYNGNIQWSLNAGPNN